MITKYFINHAQYKAEDDNGKTIIIDIDYWNNKYQLSEENQDLSILLKSYYLKNTE